MSAPVSADTGFQSLADLARRVQAQARAKALIEHMHAAEADAAVLPRADRAALSDACADLLGALCEAGRL